MRTSDADAPHPFELPADALSDGFQWRVVELDRSLEPGVPLFLRLRFSRL